MSPDNKLISLAYIQTANNPIQVFCEYIAICLSEAPGGELDSDGLIRRIADKFGIEMSANMIKMCTDYLKRNSIIRINKRHSFELVDKLSLNSEFERKCKELDQSERILINDLVTFLKKSYNKEWDYEEARENLIDYLMKDGNTAFIFSNKRIRENEKQRKLHPDWYIGKFISSILEREYTSQSNYLMDVIRGLMVYIGVYESDDYRMDYKNKYEGTMFFLDTKLTLRMLGFTTKFETKAADELRKLMTETCKGCICIFEHTEDEVMHALESAYRQMKDYETVKDEEIKLWIRVNELSLDDVSIHKNSISAKLRKLGIIVYPDPDCKNEKYVLNENNLVDYIFVSSQKRWNEDSIKNDVLSVKYINYLRKGKYNRSFGGASKLPIFITTNSKLGEFVRCYSDDPNGDYDSAVTWNKKCSPIIKYNSILYRLWLPVANEYSELPVLMASKNAYAASHLEDDFFSNMMERLKSIMLQDEGAVFDLPQIRIERLEELLAKNTGGNVEEFSDDALVLSFEEMQNEIHQADKDRINTLEAEGEKQNEKHEKFVNDSLDLTCSLFMNKWKTMDKFIIWVSHHLKLLYKGVILVLGALVSTASVFIHGFGWLFGMCLMLTICLEILDCFLKSKRETISKAIDEWEWNRFKHKTEHIPIPDELNSHIDEIYDKCKKVAGIQMFDSI